MCKQAKFAQNAYNSLLQSLPVLEKLFVDLTIDFVVGLPMCQGYNAIFMVVDQLSKNGITYHTSKIIMVPMQKPQQAYFFATFGVTIAF